MTLALCVAIAVVAAAAIAGHYARPVRRWLVYLCRPAAGLLILALALGGDPRPDPRYFWGIVAGLVFALAGDVLLMLPRNLFVYGLFAFALTHVGFLVALTSRAPFAGHPLPFLILGAVGLAVGAVIWPGVGRRLRLPVILYVSVLVAMAAQAWSRHQDLTSTATLCAAAGATLFLGSDAMLSIDTFRRPFRAARLLVLSTFYAADTLIALSLALGG